MNNIDLYYQMLLNYYHIAGEVYSSDSLVEVDEHWNNLVFHETQACGDVLLR